MRDFFVGLLVGIVAGVVGCTALVRTPLPQLPGHISALKHWRLKGTTPDDKVDLTICVHASPKTEMLDWECHVSEVEVHAMHVPMPEGTPHGEDL